MKKRERTHAENMINTAKDYSEPDIKAAVVYVRSANPELFDWISETLKRI